MKGTMNYSELINNSISNDRDKQDFLVPAKSLRMIDDIMLSHDSIPRGITKNAHSNIYSKLRIPGAFYGRMGEHKGLRTSVVNRLLEDSNSTHFVRTLNGNVRAILSDRFKPIDNLQVLTAATPVLRDMNIEFKSATVADDNMFLQIAFPGYTDEVQPGDAVQYGLTITNSEVGNGMVKISPTIWRLVCSNGLIVKTDLKHRHIGKQMDMGEDYTVFSDETIIADKRAFELKMRDTIQSSVSEARFEALLTQMKGAVEDLVVDIPKTVKNVTKRYDFDESLQDAMLNNMFDEGNKNRWGIINAVTALAHGTDSAEDAYVYETIGSEILTMDQSQWETLVA